MGTCQEAYEVEPFAIMRGLHLASRGESWEHYVVFTDSLTAMQRI